MEITVEGGRDKRLHGHIEHAAAFKLDRSNPDSHKYSVTAACWYPIDTGMFVTGSFDQEIKVGAVLPCMCTELPIICAARLLSPAHQLEVSDRSQGLGACTCINSWLGQSCLLLRCLAGRMLLCCQLCISLYYLYAHDHGVHMMKDQELHCLGAGLGHKFIGGGLQLWAA